MFEQYLREDIREAVRATAHENISAFLEAPFGDVPRDLVETIESLADEKQRKDLVRSAAALTPYRWRL